MKPPWQLTHRQLNSGALTLAHCPRCHGKGTYTAKIPRLTGDDLSIVETQQHIACDCLQRARDLLVQANLPPGRFATAALGDLDWRAIQPPQAARMIQRYIDRLQPALQRGLGLALTGSVGTGKTHIAIGLIRLACALGIQARFHVTPDLLAQLRATYDPHRSRRPTQSDTAILHQLAAIPLLALDDLGVEKPTDWTRDRLYTLLNHRYLAQRPTIITANQTLPTLAGRLGQRITSRLTGTTLQIHLENKDHRPHWREHTLDQIGLGWQDTWTHPTNDPQRKENP